MIRRSIRRAIVGIDRRFRLREWLRADDAADREPVPTILDPYKSARELDHPLPKTVIDVGANFGQFATDALRAYPSATVYAFEPIPECYEALVAMSREYPQLHPFLLALSDHDGESEFFLSRFRDSSSLQEMLPAHVEAWPHTAIEAKIRIDVARLDSVADRLHLRPPVLAKFDVQGHELAAIRGGRETLAQCHRVVCECNFAPLYEGQPSFSEIYDELRALNFLFDGFVGPLRHPQTLELLSADAVFYRNDAGLGRMHTGRTEVI